MPEGDKSFFKHWRLMALVAAPVMGLVAILAKLPLKTFVEVAVNQVVGIYDEVTKPQTKDNSFIGFSRDYGSVAPEREELPEAVKKKIKEFSEMTVDKQRAYISHWSDEELMKISALMKKYIDHGNDRDGAAYAAKALIDQEIIARYGSGHWVQRTNETNPQGKGPAV